MALCEAASLDALDWLPTGLGAGSVRGDQLAGPAGRRGEALVALALHAVTLFFTVFLHSLALFLRLVAVAGDLDLFHTVQ